MSTPEDDKDNISGHSKGGSGLRIVLPSNEGRPALDADLKAILDDMRRRDWVTRGRLGGEDDTPDAA